MKTESFDFGFRNEKMRKAEGGMKNNYELRITNYEINIRRISKL